MNINVSYKSIPITSVDAEASLGASLCKLAAVVKLQCTAEVHRFLRGDGQMNTVMQSKARMHRIYSLPGLFTKRIMVPYIPVACLLSLLQLFKKKKKPCCHRLTTQRCAGIRTTALACAHVSGGFGGQRRMHRYIHRYIDVQTRSQLYH